MGKRACGPPGSEHPEESLARCRPFRKECAIFLKTPLVSTSITAFTYSSQYLKYAPEKYQLRILRTAELTGAPNSRQIKPLGRISDSTHARRPQLALDKRESNVMLYQQ
ncbi:hypothetical protein EVAR_92549_1 [Eumeta japonica]|uniref:Uncharacterized protein n=1 Tax=Eumeta variegata TaxID=151549 RepID=A0A4C1SZW2_EUMVA|nr:hypothetical protein EVAR_92549_1 [Eumeta japonica]